MFLANPLSSSSKGDFVLVSIVAQRAINNTKNFKTSILENGTTAKLSHCTHHTYKIIKKNFILKKKNLFLQHIVNFFLYNSSEQLRLFWLSTESKLTHCLTVRDVVLYVEYVLPTPLVLEDTRHRITVGLDQW